MASIEYADVDLTGGELDVQAGEAATFTATTESEAHASGGSQFGGGTVIAVSGIIATNNLLNGAEAWISESTVDTGLSGTGAIGVTADNTGVLDASVSNMVESGDTGVNVTLAFNSVGWEGQDIFTSSVDALLGNTLIADEIALANNAGASARQGAHQLAKTLTISGLPANCAGRTVCKGSSRLGRSTCGTGLPIMVEGNCETSRSPRRVASNAAVANPASTRNASSGSRKESLICLPAPFPAIAHLPLHPRRVSRAGCRCQPMRVSIIDNPPPFAAYGGHRPAKCHDPRTCPYPADQRFAIKAQRVSGFVRAIAKNGIVITAGARPDGSFGRGLAFRGIEPFFRRQDSQHAAIFTQFNDRRFGHVIRTLPCFDSA